MPDRFNALPRPYQPFVVRDDFIVRADLFPLPGTYNGRREERHFELDDRFAEFLSEKLAALRRAPGKYRCLDSNEPDALAESTGACSSSMRGSTRSMSSSMVNWSSSTSSG